MTEILGTPTSLSMRVSRKLSDGSYGSFEVSAELEVSLFEGVNLEDSFQSLRAWLEANVGKTIKAQKAAYDQLQPAPEIEEHFTEYGIGDHRAVPPPGALKADGPSNFSETGDYTSQHDAQAPVKAAQTPVGQPENVSGQMVTEVWKNPVMTIEFTKAGDKYLRVKGGKWVKFGCPAWQETIPFTYYTDWEPGNEYRLPDGLTEAVVQMNDKGQPKKVIEFR